MLLNSFSDAGVGALQMFQLFQLVPCEALTVKTEPLLSGDVDGEWKTCSFLFPVGFLFASCSWEHQPSLALYKTWQQQLVSGAANESNY